jgi:6-phosphofructokinase 1
MANNNSHRKLGIVVGGGPAPGINGVISSVTIEAINQDFDVYGIRDGFKNLVSEKFDPKDTAQIRRLEIRDVAHHYQRGGSILGTSRTNPTKNPDDMKRVLDSLGRVGIEYLVTIGGDDTAFSGSQVYANAGGKIRVAHVPKTIDNDLPLPAGIPTFGFETARQIGVEIARNLKEDARTTTRWYIVVSMGRAAGHLALGIGKASAATLTVIAEEFKGKNVTLDLIADLIIGSMIKRKALGKGYGVAILAEGLLEAIGAEELRKSLGDRMGVFGTIEEDDFGHLRLGEIEFGRMVRHRVADRLDELSEAGRKRANSDAKKWKHPLKPTMIDKDLGYELRCADPIPFDAEYTRNLGYGAVKFLTSPEAEKTGAVISFVGEQMVPRPFQEMIDKKTKKMRPRLVDVNSQSYECARRYMIRLDKNDFAMPERLKKLAATVKLSPDEFRSRFEYLVG